MMLSKRIISTAILIVAGLSFASIANAETFTRNLRQGARGADVQTLQRVLNQSPETKLAEVGPGAPGEETTYFGEITKSAVARFQEKYAPEILFPIQLVQGTGFVGPMTRKKLNEAAINAGITPNTQGISGGGASSGGGAGSSSGIPTTGIPGTSSGVTTGVTTTIGSSQGASGQTTITKKPNIISLSPTGGINGTIITINGEGFTPIGNTIRTNLAVFDNISSFDGKTITFKFYSDAADKQLGVDAMQQEGITVADILAEMGTLPPAASSTLPMMISVSNKNGASGFMRFDLDMDITHYLATSTVSVNTKGQFSLLRKITRFLSDITVAKVAEARRRGPSPREIALAAAALAWSNFTSSTAGVSSAGGAGGAGPAFGGTVIAIMPCPCSAGVAFTIRPVAGSPGPYFAPFTSIKANYSIYLGNWVLGSAPPPPTPVCLTAAWCFSYSARLVTPIPGVGTSGV